MRAAWMTECIVSHDVLAGLPRHELGPTKALKAAPRHAPLSPAAWSQVLYLHGGRSSSDLR
jgi:hypothetical protein